MEQIALPLFIVCAALSALLILREISLVQRERLMMTKLRNSNFYAKMYPMVRRARRCELDQVRIERGRVIFFSLFPAGKLCEYTLSNEGFRILSGYRTRALAEVLGEDIPVLNSHRYSLRRYIIIRPNGQKEYGYVYTLRALYKAQMIYGRSHTTYENKTSA